MNLSELLNMGIIASVGGDGGLLLNAPKGALNPELIERISRHKPSLIAEMRAAPIRATRWLLHYADRGPMEVWFAPAADHAEALALYPEAIAAVPIPDRTSMRAASASERAELLALAAIYAAMAR